LRENLKISDIKAKNVKKVFVRLFVLKKSHFKLNIVFWILNIFYLTLEFDTALFFFTFCSVIIAKAIHCLLGLLQPTAFAPRAYIFSSRPILSTRLPLTKAPSSWLSLLPSLPVPNPTHLSSPTPYSPPLPFHFP
jgi:hypothetical protein